MNRQASAIHDVLVADLLSQSSRGRLCDASIRYRRIGRGSRLRIPNSNDGTPQADGQARDGRRMVPLSSRLWVLAVERRYEYSAGTGKLVVFRKVNLNTFTLSHSNDYTRAA